ncbi:MAG TPA: hypothetical protein EYN91_16320 [Candidatus Melainabacteria bacterium]|nr:hypothetical protein [Candidatus Melainabacteria bacterium]HIN66305.1 hypothetical protein [Candidatus Obscuribacterales bacterium]
MTKKYMAGFLAAVIPMLCVLPGEAQTSTSTQTTTTVSKTRPVLRLKKRVPRRHISTSTVRSSSQSNVGANSSVKVQTQTSITK